MADVLSPIRDFCMCGGGLHGETGDRGDQPLSLICRSELV